MINYQNMKSSNWSRNRSELLDQNNPRQRVQRRKYCMETVFFSELLILLIYFVLVSKKKNNFPDTFSLFADPSHSCLLLVLLFFASLSNSKNSSLPLKSFKVYLCFAFYISLKRNCSLHIHVLL